MTDGFKENRIKDEFPSSEGLRKIEGLVFQISEDGQVFFSGEQLLREVIWLRERFHNDYEEKKRLYALVKSLMRKLRGVRKRRKNDALRYEKQIRLNAFKGEKNDKRNGNA